MGALTTFLAGCGRSPDQFANATPPSVSVGPEIKLSEVEPLLLATSKDPVYFSYGAVLNSDPKLKIRVNKRSMNEIFSHLPEIIQSGEKYVLIITELTDSAQPQAFRDKMPPELRLRIDSVLLKPNDKNSFHTLFILTSDAIRNIVGFGSASPENKIKLLSLIFSVGIYYNLKRDFALSNGLGEPPLTVPANLFEFLSKQPAIVVTELVTLAEEPAMGGFSTAMHTFILNF